MTTYPETPIPCIHCGAPTILFSDGKARGHKTGKTKPDGKPEWHRQPQSAVAVAPSAHVAAPGSGQPAPVNQPSAAPGADEQPPRDPTRVSIERQVAVKAATEVYLGLLEKRSPDSFKGDEANAEKIAGWIVRVAAVLGAYMAHGDDVIQRAAAPQITSTPPGAAP